jgi:two-component system, chemotaxis family, response regulator Rcp1
VSMMTEGSRTTGDALAGPWNRPEAVPRRLGGTPGRIEILLVEDSPADAELALQVLKEANVHSNLSVVGDGEAAMAFLHKRGPYADSPRPDLILLDLNLPRKDGREVLAELKQTDGLRQIPVVVLSASPAEEDIADAYEKHANAYIKKPVGLNDFVMCVRLVEAFWLGLVCLPPAGGRT